MIRRVRNCDFCHKDMADGTRIFVLQVSLQAVLADGSAERPDSRLRPAVDLCSHGCVTKYVNSLLERAAMEELDLKEPEVKQ